MEAETSSLKPIQSHFKYMGQLIRTFWLLEVPLCLVRCKGKARLTVKSESSLSFLKYFRFSQMNTGPLKVINKGKFCY